MRNGIYISLLVLVALVISRCSSASLLTGMEQAPLRELIKSGNVEALESRLTSGANPDEFSEGEPLIIWAWKNDNMTALRMLIQFGADPNLTNESGRTLLMFVARRCDVDLLEFLIQNGADVNARTPEWDSPLTFSLTGLHQAQRCQDGAMYPTVELLLKKGANPNRRNSIGITPLTLAVLYRRLDIAKLLVEYGGNTRKPSITGQSPIKIAENKGYNEIAEFLKSQ